MSGPDKKSKHLLRLNRFRGQVEAIQRALEGDARVRPFFSGHRVP